MKLSELTVEAARAHTRTDPDDVLDHMYLEAAKRYVLDYTGLTAAEADERPYLTVAALVLFAEMTDNKSLSTDNSKVNRVLASFLDICSVNLL